MKRCTSFFAIASLLCWAAPAAAAGINLGWNDCPSGPDYALTETFACNTNVGTHTIVGSFVAPPGVVAMTANAITIDMMTSRETAADWWSLREFNPAGCRPLSLKQSADFTGGPGTCADYWQGAAYGGISMGEAYLANRARIKVIEALPYGDPRIREVAEGTEVYSFKVIIDDTKTVGVGACGGCTDEACIVFTALNIDQPADIAPYSIRLEYPATSQHVLWQGWSNPDPQQQCPAVTPARTRTWGSIKALYR